MKKFFLSLFLCSPVFASMDRLIDEYPELEELVTSQEFNQLLPNCPIKTAYCDPEKIPQMALYKIKASTVNGVKSKIVLNSFYIDRELFDPEEFKYMLCHEVGHFNDPKLRRTMFAGLGWGLWNLGFTAFVLKSLVQTKWRLALKQLGIGAGLSFLGYLMLMKLSRNREMFADEFALKMTKNKEAAESALLKRAALMKHEPYKWAFLNKIRSLLDDHPSESARIAHIRQVANETPQVTA